tara:strand:+ start:604 stop:1482 length:879 start_codon:yes stop_codon:yes gene_type:complete
MGDFAKPCHELEQCIDSNEGDLIHSINSITLHKPSCNEMKKSFPDSIIESPRGELIQTLNLDGDHHMALDVLLFEKLVAKSNFSIAARFYKWNGNWLSLGRNQKEIPPKWLELARLNKLKLVRRPSGGGAVLHSGGLTYSLFWESPPKKKREAYFKASEWLLESFSSLGLSLKFGDETAGRICKNCFSTATGGDLIDGNGQKRVGNAQYWKKGKLLQHGEIILTPPENLWRDVFETDPPQKSIVNFNAFQLEQSLVKSLKRSWPKTNWEERSLTNEELNEVRSKAKDYLIRN